MIKREKGFDPVTDPDLQISGGWGVAVIQTLKEEGARSKRIFFSALRASVRSKNKWGPGPPGASPGSCTVRPEMPTIFTKPRWKSCA